MSQRPYHHGNLRAELLERAWDIVDRDGAEALSLRGIARSIGVSHGASARHFRDRQALLDMIAVTGFRRLNMALDEAAAVATNAEEKLRATGRAYVQFAVTHPRILEVMYAAKHHPDATDEMRALGRAAMDTLVATILAAQEAGEARPGDPGQLALIAFANVHGVATLATDGLLDGVSWSQATDLTVDFLWQAITSLPKPLDRATSSPAEAATT